MCSEPKKPPRIPFEHQGIQFNFCKNPKCSNYASLPKSRVGSGRLRVDDRDTYRLNGGGKDGLPKLLCVICNTQTALKSNLGIYEEFERIRCALNLGDNGCTNTVCGNLGKSTLNFRTHYRVHGTTKAGTTRYQCKACLQVFTSAPKKIRQSKRPDISKLVFSLLINKMPMRRICETASIRPATLYGKIRQIHQQCLLLNARYEAKFRDADFSLHRLYLSVDRQEYTFNWGAESDRRNTLLLAIASADQSSGYVLGMHLNFDHRLESEIIERDAIILGDYDLPCPHRRYARLWLQREYRDNFRQFRRLNKRKTRLTAKDLSADEALTEEFSDDAPVQSSEFKLPSTGMQIHSEYTMIAHFHYLKYLTERVEKVRFFLDQDSGMRSSCLGVFADRVKQRTADAFFVRIAKDLTNSQKKALVARSKIDLNKMCANHPELTHHEIEINIIKERMRNLVPPAANGDQWLMHPFSDMSEPEKAVCYITNLSDMEENHLAALYRKASLSAIDRFFMQIRRRISILERPIGTASSAGRMWFGYSAYNPAVAIQLMEIFRIVHNFVLVGDDKKTPAMRIGLIDRPILLEEIVNIS